MVSHTIQAHYSPQSTQSDPIEEIDLRSVFAQNPQRLCLTENKDQSPYFQSLKWSSPNHWLPGHYLSDLIFLQYPPPLTFSLHSSSAVSLAGPQIYHVSSLLRAFKLLFIRLDNSPPGIFMACSLTSFWSLLKCQLLSKAFPGHSI